MKRFLVSLFLCGSLMAATEPINVNTGDGLVKQTSSGVGVETKPFDFSNVFVTGINQGGSGVSQLLSGGGVAWTGTGFNYIISAATYMINGVTYISPQTPVTLAAADPTQDRIDVFYVDTSGTAGVITGTPGTPPIQPSVDPSSQLYLTFAYVVAASTTPVITNVNIYLENTEYTMSTGSPGTINLASTNNPYAGTKCIEGTATVNGNQFTATKPSGTLDLSQYQQLTFQLRSKGSWPNAKSISIFWRNGISVVGASVAVKNGTFGFDSSNTTTYQQIVIPAASFGTGTNPVDSLRMSVSGGGNSIGWYIDNIILQAGGGGGGGGGTLTNFSSGNLPPLFTTTVTNPTTTPILNFFLSTASAHNYFGNNTGSTGAPAFHQISYSELTGTPTIPTDLSALHFITTQSESALSNEFSLGSLASGILYQTVSSSVSTPAIVTIGSGLTFSGGTLAATATTQNHSVTFTVDGSGGVLTTGTKHAIKIPFGGTLQGWVMIASPASSSVTADVLRAADGAGLPVTSIVGGGGTKPAISSGVENSSTSFTGWTSTTITANDNLAFSLSGITNA